MVPEASLLRICFWFFAAMQGVIKVAGIENWEHWNIINGPNEHLFVDSLKHYSDGQHLSFNMLIKPNYRCKENEKKPSDLTICGMELILAASFSKEGKVWWRFVANKNGVTMLEESTYWSEFFSNSALIAGEYCPGLRIGKVFLLSKGTSIDTHQGGVLS